MKTNKILYGFLAFGPIGLLVVAIGSLFLTEMLDIPHRDQMALMPLVMIAMFGGGILGVVSLVMHILHVQKNPRIPADQRMIWILAIVMANGIASIAYFFMYIVKEGDVMPQSGKPHDPRWD